MTREARVVYLWLIVLSVSISLLMSLYVLDRRATERQLGEIEQRIRRGITRDRLIGQSPDRVLAFLDREGIPHGKYMRRAPAPSMRAEWDRTISAELFNVVPGWDIFLVFRFDTGDRLTSYDITRRGVVL